MERFGAAVGDVPLGHGRAGRCFVGAEEGAAGVGEDGLLGDGGVHQQRLGLVGAPHDSRAGRVRVDEVDGQRSLGSAGEALRRQRHEPLKNRETPRSDTDDRDRGDRSLWSLAHPCSPVPPSGPG